VPPRLLGGQKQEEETILIKGSGRKVANESLAKQKKERVASGRAFFSYVFRSSSSVLVRKKVKRRRRTKGPGRFKVGFTSLRGTNERVDMWEEKPSVGPHYRDAFPRGVERKKWETSDEGEKVSRC